MTPETLVTIVTAIVTIICALISAYLVPFLKSKFSTEQLEVIKRYTIIAVRAAEQIFTPEEWRDKKEWVTEYITEIAHAKLHLNLNRADIDILIEGVVNEVKHSYNITDKEDKE